MANVKKTPATKTVKATVNTGLAKMPEPTELDIMLQFIEGQKAKLKHITESNYATPGKLDHFNLQTETKTEAIISMIASVMIREKAYNEAAAALDLTSYPAFKIEGYESKYWLQDAKLRMAIVNNKEMLDKIDSFTRRAEELMDKEDKKNRLAREMAEAFGG